MSTRRIDWSTLKLRIIEALFVAFILGICLGLITSRAHAQTAGSITFTSSITTTQSGGIPVLTWSTTPVATDCTATGAWTGSKGAAGTETQPAITSSKQYTLTCFWGALLGSAKLTWTQPTTNEDGTPVVGIESNRVFYGQTEGSLNKVLNVGPPPVTTVTINDLAAGTWYFRLSATSTDKVESDRSAVVSKTIPAQATAVRTVAVTVFPKPKNPTGVTVQ